MRKHFFLICHGILLFCVCSETSRTKWRCGGWAESEVIVVTMYDYCEAWIIFSEMWMEQEVGFNYVPQYSRWWRGCICVCSVCSLILACLFIFFLSFTCTYTFKAKWEVVLGIEKWASDVALCGSDVGEDNVDVSLNGWGSHESCEWGQPAHSSCELQWSFTASVLCWRLSWDWWKVCYDRVMSMFCNTAWMTLPANCKACKPRQVS